MGQTVKSWNKRKALCNNCMQIFVKALLKQRENIFARARGVDFKKFVALLTLTPPFQISVRGIRKSRGKVVKTYDGQRFYPNDTSEREFDQIQDFHKVKNEKVIFILIFRSTTRNSLNNQIP